MACDNEELSRLPQEGLLQLDTSMVFPQSQVYISSYFTKQKSSPVRYIDYQTDPSQFSQFLGRLYYQCPPAKAFSGNACGQPGLSKRKQRNSDSSAYYCELCKVSCAGKISFKCHLAGKKHQRMEHLKRSSEEEYNPKEIICAVCDVKCSGLETYNSHLQGKQHAKTVKLQKSRGCEIPDVKPQTSSNQSSLSSPINPENCIKEFYSGKNKQYSCRLCSCICNNSQVKDAHLMGKKHRTALRKLKQSLETATAKDQSNSTLEVEVPTEHTLHAQPETNSSSSRSPSSTERPQIPPMGFARPSGPCMTPSGLQALISLPPHLLADERYMQTKLEHITPSKEENDLMILAVDAVCSALRQIYGAGSDSDEDLLSSDELNGVYLVGPAAIGLQLGGQRTADVVLVFRHPLSPNCVDEIREELERMLKITCEGHRVTLINEEETQLVVEIGPNPSSPHPGTSKALEASETSSSSDLLAARIRIRFAPSFASSDLKKTEEGEEGPGTKPPDQLNDVRQIVWIQEVLAAHPDKKALLNVARLVRCLIRDSLPVPWGEFPDYVLVVLLGHLSLMDLPPPGTYRSSLPRIRPGLLFRRFLEFIASGVLIDRNGELSSMPDRPGSKLLLLDRMKTSDRIAATSAAQEALRLVAFRQIYKLLNLPRFVPPCLTHYLPKNGVKSPSIALKPTTAQKSSMSLGKRKVSNNDEALNGSGCGESGGFGGDTSFLDDQPPSEKVIKLDEEGYYDFVNDSDKRVVCGDSTVQGDIEVQSSKAVS